MFSELRYAMQLEVLYLLCRRGSMTRLEFVRRIALAPRPLPVSIRPGGGHAVS